MRRFSLILPVLVLAACSKDETTAPVQESSSGSERSAPAPVDERMTLDRMDAMFRSFADNVQRNEDVWTLEYLRTPVLVVTAPNANRMRLVAQVAHAGDVAPEQLAATMVANFHSALDARYAISGEWLYSIYLHPLESLSEGELRSAVSQVVMLVQTFGTTYRSAGIVFGGGAEEPQHSNPDKKAL